MIERLVTDRRWLATSLLLVVVAGLSSFATIVRQEDPTITNGVGIVVAPYPGADARRVEALVTSEIEEELRELPEIKTLSSVSRNGVAVVAIELDEDLRGDETSPAFSKIRDALDDAYARFPTGVPPPQLDDERFGAYTMVLAIRWEMDTPPSRGILKRFGDELADRLRDIPGTDVVRIFGAPPEEILVATAPDLLAAAGLTPDAVAQAIRRADSKVPAGTLRTKHSNVVLEVAGALDSLDRVRNVPLRTTDGAWLTVGDVAEVRRQVQEPAGDLVLVDGRPAVVVAAQLATGSRFDQWAGDVEQRSSAFASSLPAGLSVDTVFDQTRYTDARLHDLYENLVVGLVIVVLILVLTLGLRSALVVALTLPLVSLASIAVLRALDVPIHQMSITGLIVALGLMVDSAIVVVDAIRHRRLEGATVMEAVSGAIGHLRLPLLSSTITTVLAFMPILLLKGRVGEFVGTLGLSVVIAIISSFVIATTLVAAIAGIFVKPTARGERSWLRRTFDEGLTIGWLSRVFDRSVATSLRYPKLSIALVLTLPIAGFVGATQLPKQFFPPADRDQFHLELRLPSQASIDDTTRATEQVEEVLRSHAEVTHVHWFIGRSAPPFYYNLRQDQDGTPSYAQAQVTVSSSEVVAPLLRTLHAELVSKVPRARVLLRELLQGPPVDAPIELRVYGTDVGELRRLGEVLRERMSRIPTVTHAMATLTAGSPKLWVDADEDAIHLAGLDLRDVSRQLETHLEGVVGGSVLEGTEDLDVRVRAASPQRSGVAELMSINLASPRSLEVGVPLSAVAKLRLTPELDGIPHRDGQRVNIVRGYTYAGVFPETALGQLEAVLAEAPIEVPPGYRIETGGDAEKRGKAMDNLFTYLPVLVLLMLAAVGLTLGSYRLAAVIFTVAFASIGLGMLSLVVTGYPLGFQAIIGLIGLVGVAVNDAIVIASALKAQPEAAAGSPDAIRHIVVGETSRHVVSTTVTTFGGFLPLILAGGGFWPPFAIAIAGGVLLSTVVAFYFVPASFLLIARRSPKSEPAGGIAMKAIPTSAALVALICVLLPNTAHAEPRAWTVKTVAERARDLAPDAAAAEARIAEAEFAEEQAWIAFAPRTTLSARYTRLGGIENDPLVPDTGPDNPLGGLTIEVPANQIALSLVVAYPISQAFTELWPAAQAQRAVTTAHRHDRAATDADVTLRAVTLLMDHARAKAAHRVASDTVRAAERDFAQVKAQSEVGLAASPDVLRLKARVASAKRERAERYVPVAATAAALRALLDLPGEGTLAVGTPLMQLPPPESRPTKVLVDRALAQRPEMKALASRADAVDHQADAKMGAMWPSLTASFAADYARPNALFTPPGDGFRGSWSASLVVSWSPDAAFGASAGAKRRRAAARATRRQRDAVADSIRVQVYESAAAYHAARLAFGAAQDQVKAARAAHAARRAAFAAGIVTVNELIASEVDAHQARVAVIDTAAAAHVAHARLGRAIGDGR